MNRRIGSRIVSIFMAVVLCSVMLFDGTAKAALQENEYEAENGYETEVEYEEENRESPESVSQNAISEEEEEVLDEEANEGKEADLATNSSTEEIEYTHYTYTAPKQYSYLNSLKKTKGDIQEECYINNTIDMLTAGTDETVDAVTDYLKDEGKDFVLKIVKNNDLNLLNDATSVFGSGWSMWEDVNKLTHINKDSLHEHSSMKAVQGVLYTTDLLLATASFAAVAAGCSVAAPSALLVGAVSVAISVVDSEGFANIMNDMDNDILRFLDALVDSIFMDTKTALGIQCYKPNIYIYGAEGKRITVRFIQPELLVKTEPYYNNESGWIVDAGDEGVLTDLQGNEYAFLFYESMTEKRMFDTTEGFAISTENREKEFENILSDMGFNEEEICDFIEFWNEKLDCNKDYIMYPQYTDVVDEAMPVVISPQPDRIIRIWFVFEEDYGQKFRQTEAEPIKREGYTVVEWGGMIY